MSRAVLVIDMQEGMADRIRAGRPTATPDAPDRIAALLLPARALPGETVFWKHGSSAFHGTRLDAHLRALGIAELVVAGAVVAFCVTSTVRQASDLGYTVLLPQDALLGFDLPAHDGGTIDARTVFRVTLSLLGADFATLTTVADLAPQAA